MLEYERKVSAFIESHQLIANGDRVLIAVSGGPDSLSLLHYLYKRQEFYKIQVAAVHVDHMLRGKQSNEDLLFVQKFCATYGIPFHSKAIDIKKIMDEENKGMQETARQYRYKYFAEIVNGKDFNKLAFGHHGDDQVETVLMRMTRGAVGKSRAGIPFKRPFERGYIIRPLLPLQKKEIEEYCTRFGLEPRRDPSNDKDDYTRNRFRHRVLPALKEENPKVHEQFQRFSEEMLEDEYFLQELTKVEMNKLWNSSDGEISIEITPFKKMPLPLQRRGIQLILNYLYKDLPSSLSAVHIHDIFRLIGSNHPSGHIDLPKALQVRRSYDHCLFTFRQQTADEPFEYELPMEGVLPLPDGDEIIIRRGIDQDLHSRDNQNFFCVDPSRVIMPLKVRTRKQGDRIAIKGLNGTKKVKDIFIDQKIPLKSREGWPLVTDQSGTILWLPGLKKSIYDEPDLNKPFLVLQYISQSSSRGPLN
ncbi:tRNA lysidine(34) synthetase TilS [Falsibacillus albus]|uniref:tRNA(Ile)-lysidine synthase n=1 Tax=Falsibacillus albus TaxID=2478915 RepID=A0A3L7JN28_9BACI|nr:tRNA lysidine(34) synthetase TilS [Falsibacillus albus]RLQ91675.1 tRNA lysidine(34) synthetase TilS [Falsibacillus albus]